MQISFKNVSFTYSLNSPFEHEALNDISLEIKEGSFTCIVGQTGCGKSTLIQQINGLLIPTQGEVNVGDFIICNDRKRCVKKFSDLRKNVGIVFQFSEYQLFDQTVEEDVAFGPINYGVSKPEAINLAHEYLKKVDIPESYYKKSPFDLSGGEKRRVAIAGILTIQPKVLILDEPTAGLDVLGAKDILDLLVELNKNGTTIIIVTHDMDIVYRYADHVIVLNNGKVVLDTIPSKLFSDDVEKYSLEMPLLSKSVQIANANGLNLDSTKIRNVTELVDEILKGKAK